MILAGDIGATKTLLAIGETGDNGWHPIFERRYADSEYDEFSSMMDDFLSDFSRQDTDARKIQRACFGIAGPVLNGGSKLTNRSWHIDSDLLARRFSIPPPVLVNDMVATAYGISMLAASDLATLQTGETVAAAPKLVIGVGTGFGTACIVPCGPRQHVLAGEGGHMGFAPRTPEQNALWQYLHAHDHPTTIEAVASGSGMLNIYDFMLQSDQISGHTHTSPVSAMDITRLATGNGKSDALARLVLDLFVDCLGNAIGDLALAMLPMGGIYLTGGIAPNLLSPLESCRFINAFNDKSMQSDITRRMPVHVVKNEHVALLGCAQISSH